MKDTYPVDAGSELSAFEESLLKQVLTEHVEEIVPDELVSRVMSPIRTRIESGEFTKANRRRKLRRPFFFTLAAAGVASALMFAYPRSGHGQVAEAPPNVTIEVQDPAIPLAGAPNAGLLANATLTVVNEQNMETLSVTDNMENMLSDGTWKIMMTINGESTEVGRIIVENGTTRLIK